MQIIAYNSHGSQLVREEDSRAIRIAYLLGENVVIAGSIVYDFDFKKMIALTPFKYKLQILETFFKSKSYDGVDFDKIRRMVHTYNTAKNKTPQLIAAYKKIEFSYTKMYKNVSYQFFEKILQVSGFVDIKELIDEEKVQVVITSLGNQERPSNNEIKGSTILSLDFKQKINHKIFIIGNQLFEKPFVYSFTYVDLGSEAAANEDQFFLQPLLRIPNLIVLKATELKLIRNSLNAISVAFNNQMNEWIDACFNNENFAKRKELLQTKLLPLATELNMQINANVNIEHIAKLTNMEQAIEVFIGEIPFQLLLDYNLHYNIIEQDTIEQMKVLQQKDERFNRRWPVIIYRSADAKNINLKFDVDEVEESNLLVKKMISLD